VTTQLDEYTVIHGCPQIFFHERKNFQISSRKGEGKNAISLKNTLEDTFLEKPSPILPGQEAPFSRGHRDTQIK
jgi:hypothetical protein